MKNPLKRLLGMHGKSPAPTPMSHDERASFKMGTIKWFNAEKGFGFLTPDGGGPDVFCHYSDIQSRGFRTLEEGQRVSYTLAQGQKGMQAAEIQPI